MEAVARRSATTAQGVGALLREWRVRRGRSQLDLAPDVGVSPRHLSFIETGRSRPSAPMLHALAHSLDVPLREHNRMLLAAGHAPRYAERPLSSAALAGVRSALQRLLDAHQPYPGFVLDRQWSVVHANAAGQALAALLPSWLTTPGPLNAFRAGLHPNGLAAHTVNFQEWGAYLVRQLRQLVARSPGDAELAALEAEVLGYPNVKPLSVAAAAADDPGAVPTLLVPFVLDLPAGRISMFSTLTSFGTPTDVTLDELCVELFYPMDSGSERLLRAAVA